MRNLNIYQGLFFLLVPVLALFAITCNGNGPGETCPSGNPTRTDGNDEFKRWLAQVFKNSGEVTDDCWHPLDSDDTLSTDSSGEAELNFSDCYPGRLYCFKNSSGTIRVKGCRKAEYPTEATCVLDGSWYTGACAGEYQLHTGSGLIKKVSSTFSTTYLPENRDITLVIVLDGRVEVTPVETFDPTVLGLPLPVAEGFFLFTMPNAQLSDVAGLPPRTSHPISDLDDVAIELGIVDWMFDVRDKADESGILPADWPAELGGEGPEEPPTEEPPIAGDGYNVVSSGGVLVDPRAQQVIASAIDWQAVAQPGQVVTVFVEEQPLNALTDLTFDPDASRQLLAESGYPDGFPATLLYPEEDQKLAEVAAQIAEDLNQIGVEVVVEAVPAAEIDGLISRFMAASEPIIILTR